MLQWGLYAAGIRLPFLPTRAGLGSDVLKHNPDLKLVQDPYGDRGLVAMPPLRLDAALVHMNRADAQGNGQFLGPDPYFDDLYCLAADQAFMSCERIVPTAELSAAGHSATIKINRQLVAGVVETPNGAHFTSCAPDYERDEAFQREYVKAAGDPQAWASVREAVPVRYRSRLPGGRRRPSRGGRMSSAATEQPTGSATTADAPVTRAEYCAVAVADAFAGDGESSPAPSARSRPSASASPGSPSPPTCCSPTVRPTSSPAPGRSARTRTPPRASSSRAGARSARSSTSSGTASGTS